MFWTRLIIDFLLTLYVLDCLFMLLVILMQRSKQEGLGAAFGGGLTESVFGAQTSQVLVKATVYAAILFFGLSITLARLYSHLDVIESKGSPVQQLLSQPVAAPAKPAATTTSDTTPAPAASTAPAPIAPTAATTTVPSPVTPSTAKPAATPPPASK
jgi:preprotein translocase subunit SecG